jgi:glutaredoxin-dependent peroxiredoxin
MPLAVGDTAPDFELTADTWGKDAVTYKLSDALAEGGVVLQFFPLPFTGTCESQMCAVRDHVEDYRGAGVTVWGVTGHYPQLIAAWDREHSFGVPILADYDHEVSTTYVGLYEDVLPVGLRLTSKRAVLGISKDGVVRSLWVSEVPGVGPDDAVMRTAIDAARG